MTSPFELLASADFLVPDRVAAVSAVQERLGFVEPRPRWTTGGPGSGHQATFCRPNPSLGDAPTLVELIQGDTVDPDRSLADVVPNIAGLVELQGARPLKTHGTPVAGSDVDALIETVRSKGLRHWVQPASERYPYHRLWMGIVEYGLADYRPEADGGLMLEVIHLGTVRLPPEASHPASVGGPDEPAAMVRPATRVFLVDDLDRSLDQLAAGLGWEPESGPEEGHSGARRAVLGFALDRSARIELLAPDPGSDAGAFLAAWGPGLWSLRIAVNDLGAKAEDLRSRGTAFVEASSGFARPETVLRVDTGQTPGCLFEFVPR